MSMSAVPRMMSLDAVVTAGAPKSSQLQRAYSMRCQEVKCDRIVAGDGAVRGLAREDRLSHANGIPGDFPIGGRLLVLPRCER